MDSSAPPEEAATAAVPNAAIADVANTALARLAKTPNKGVRANNVPGADWPEPIATAAADKPVATTGPINGRDATLPILSASALEPEKRKTNPQRTWCANTY